MKLFDLIMEAAAKALVIFALHPVIFQPAVLLKPHWVRLNEPGSKPPELSFAAGWPEKLKGGLPVKLKGGLLLKLKEKPPLKLKGGPPLKLKGGPPLKLKGGP